jgi:signal transduction histidine kinase
MSVSVRGRRNGRFPRTAHEPPPARAFLWFISILILALGVPGAGRVVDDESRILELFIWAAVVGAVDLLPIRVWGSVSVSMSFPVSLAAGMVFLPTEAAMVSFLGSFDPRELRGEVSLAKSVFNRSQVAGSVMASSAAFHGLGGDVLEWPSVLVPGVVALLLDGAVNVVLVVCAVALEDRVSLRAVLQKTFGSSPVHYVAGYLVLGVLALPLAAAVAVGGSWALLLCLAPLALAREMFQQTQRVLTVSERIREKDSALLSAAQELARERKDERMALAGELHDEVLPALFKVHLMGQVLKQDLASGRLLELEEDLPELLAATEDARHGIRQLVGDLRRSPIGAAGLTSTIQLLAQQLRAAGSPPILLDLEAIEGTAVSQLLAYQLVREALNNAAKYARASRIAVRLRSDDGTIRVSVSDDGIGFDPSEVDQGVHFGLQIMRERFDAAGGHLFVDTQLGRGTTVAGSLPAGI